MDIKKRMVFCKDCGKKYESEDNRGVKSRERLCPKCWKRKRKNCHSKGDKRCGKNSTEGETRIDVHGDTKRFSKMGRKEIDKRNAEIIKLNEIVDSLSKENIRLKERIKTSGISLRINSDIFNDV